MNEEIGKMISWICIIILLFILVLKGIWDIISLIQKGLEQGWGTIITIYGFPGTHKVTIVRYLTNVIVGTIIFLIVLIIVIKKFRDWLKEGVVEE